MGTKSPPALQGEYELVFSLSTQALIKAAEAMIAAICANILYVENFYILLRLICPLLLSMLALVVIPSAARHDGGEGVTAMFVFFKAQIFSFQFFQQFFQQKTNKIMKKLMFSFFSLLLFAAATTTAQAADIKKLAVLVVGMDDWMLGDVLAHLVGEELNRGKTYEVVTRSNAVQNKLEALRRGNDRLDDALLHAWATAQGINTLCLVTTTPGLNFSLRLLDVSSGEVQCNGSRVEPNAVALKQLAWSLAGNLGSGCTPSGEDYTEPLIEMEMVYVEGGEFRMGCAGTRDGGTNNVSSGANGDCDAQEEPDHSVTVGNFWIGKHEVTQGQWEAVMGSTIEDQQNEYDIHMSFLYGVGANFPMYYVSWAEAVAFCVALSTRTGKLYRLATEEEWEYAARGGKLSRGYLYSGSNSIDSVAWYASNSGDNGGSSNKKTHIVGTTTKQGNELGICDMSGNVWEWCSSGWRDNYNETLEDDSRHVVRGGSWTNYSSPQDCRVAYRHSYWHAFRGNSLGFRVV
jgi:formylglycine-generating enzyme required for sulfatase activity